jgi:hypothetical protein
MAVKAALVDNSRATSQPMSNAPVVKQDAGRDTTSTTSTKQSSYSVDGGTIAEGILGLIGALVVVLGYRLGGHLMDHLFAKSLMTHKKRLTGI